MDSTRCAERSAKGLLHNLLLVEEHFSLFHFHTFRHSLLEVIDETTLITLAPGVERHHDFPAQSILELDPEAVLVCAKDVDSQIREIEDASVLVDGLLLSNNTLGDDHDVIEEEDSALMCARFLFASS